MPARLLILDLKHDLLSAVIVETGAKGMTIAGQSMVAPSARSQEESLEALLQGLDTQDAICHLNLAPQDLLYRNLTLPFADSKTISRILPLEMQDNIPIRIDRLHIDALVTRINRQKSQIIAAMVDRELLTATLEQLARLQITPQTISVSGLATALRILHSPAAPAEFLLLDISLQGVLLILGREGRIDVIRPLIFDAGLQAGFQLSADQQSIQALRPEHITDSVTNLCAAVRQTLQSLFYTGSPTIFLCGPLATVAEINTQIQSGLGPVCQLITTLLPEDDCSLLSSPGHPLHAAILVDAINSGWQQAKRWKDFNFRKGEFALKKTFVAGRRLALILLLPLALAGLVGIGLLWRSQRQLTSQEQELNQQIQSIFRETLPEVTRIVDPIQQLQVKIKETGQGATDQQDATLPALSVLRILTEISAGIPASLDVHLARFMVDDTGIRIKGSTDTFNTVDAIKKGLEQSTAFSAVEISSANLDPKNSRIRFEMKLTIKGA